MIAPNQMAAKAAAINWSLMPNELVSGNLDFSTMVFLKSSASLIYFSRSAFRFLNFSSYSFSSFF